MCLKFNEREILIYKYVAKAERNSRRNQTPDDTQKKL